ncbi:hypothetical protein R1flu_000585 [Riccia fluitans]|uniref:Uncharacterized protein n=1 Tax=Riccia fluitans TaxID=41844 RepID=A0ABD1Y0W4_9MARC
MRVKVPSERTTEEKVRGREKFDISTTRVAESEGKMESSPKAVRFISDIVEGGKRNFAKRFELYSKKASQLRENVARNVRTLTGNAAIPDAAIPTAVDASDQPPPIMAEPSTNSNSAEVPGSTNAGAVMLRTRSAGGVGDQQARETSSAYSISNTSLDFLGPSAEEEIPSPHYDLSRVSATSVFDIGSLGTPVLGPETIEIGKVENPHSARKPDPSPVILSSRSENTSPLYNQQQPPLVDLDDVRKFVGNSITVWRKVRAYGFPESSWENKTPWRHPRPSYLAKGLQRPPEKFSSEKEKHEYYRRARRRGRYLMGPIPTWSFIVADLALLYFLIDNPAGKFLL